MTVMARPPWLKPLLGTSFFRQCKSHGDSNKNECNMFCLDCISDALCSSCLLVHRHHRIIQIRRSSYHDVIRVSEIQKVLDIGGVQTYVINGAKVVFLNHRPQPRPGKGVTYACEICDRSLQDPARFCSLGCKMAGMTSNRKSSEDTHIASSQCMAPQTPPSSCRTRRRRKGIPQRSPMGSC
ncbi:uncharacterized protein At3g50808 isoform X2 [Amborella trichopoda]|uniref:uncharacterized protein At3g50808 isoform X2 n=1 Tax=Amborella trichopoda TaxID=13333 RepID=UPI0009BE5AEA|nr:uncharacterized protein At3g50808 isoform X2 [Amborella trichopoda]|eukprot:XP_011626758.2 uncharacterized protein At3g50808 isoform X2 [Amborella trichopoda]